MRATYALPQHMTLQPSCQMLAAYALPDYMTLKPSCQMLPAQLAFKASN